MISHLRLVLEDDFPNVYQQILFPNGDVKRLVGWGNLLDILQDSGY